MVEWACVVLLVPGAFGEGASSLFLQQRDYFSEYQKYFSARHCEVRKVEFPPNATIELRSSVLRDQIQKAGGHGPLYLVAHSQGGLDARFVLSSGHAPGVSSLATIGVPHHGTPLANWVIAQRQERSLFYWLLRGLAHFDLSALPFAGEMTPAFLERHARYFEPEPGVRYGSARGICHHGCSWALELGAWWVGVGPGDGVVSGESQRFGQDLGEFDLDHVSEVGADDAKRGERTRLLDSIWRFFTTP